jgi:transposase, IS30 family
MAKNYTHLQYEERVEIRTLLKHDKSLREISRELGRAPSTVSRELRRNEQFAGTRVIYPRFAQMKANGRRRRSYRKPRLKTRLLQRYVVRKLRDGWSPRVIAGRLKHLHREVTVSHEAGTPGFALLFGSAPYAA